MSDPVRHDAAARRFEMRVDGHTAYLEYGEPEAGRLDYRSTFVPDALRGRGIASQVTAFALRYAAENGLKVTPTCPFVARYIDRHPEFRGLVVD